MVLRENVCVVRKFLSKRVSLARCTWTRPNDQRSVINYARKTHPRRPLQSSWGQTLKRGTILRTSRVTSAEFRTASRLCAKLRRGEQRSNAWSIAFGVRRSRHCGTAFKARNGTSPSGCRTRTCPRTRNLLVQYFVRHPRNPSNP